ncbi:C45 family autoproteolytic acyltransferase/hydrolase [Mesorhizobium sp. UC22_110]|uniref:C45 family autoproteolytic acyltransferase/hydolase n=1 Tax=Mesorhizobium sp. UC22_110 TaxID=3374552 RepID=UPI0037580ED7
MRTESLPIVDCAGDARRRGHAHGEALRSVILAKVERWREAIGEAYGVPASLFLPRFLEATDFRGAIMAHAPDLADEVVGIGEGAGLPEETAYALQLMDEEWWWGRSNAAHCSSLAVAPADGRPTLVAQTMDLPRWHDGAQALLKIEDTGQKSLVFTSAGMIGLMGVSGRGLGICVNTLSQLAVNPRGLPVAFVMRGALAQGTVASAAEFLGRVPHASGQNYQLGDRSEARTFECSAGGIVPVSFSNGCSLHTNHPLVSRDGRDTTARMEGSEDFPRPAAKPANGYRHRARRGRRKGKSCGTADWRHRLDNAAKCGTDRSDDDRLGGLFVRRSHRAFRLCRSTEP